MWRKIHVGCDRRNIPCEKSHSRRHEQYHPAVFKPIVHNGSGFEASRLFRALPSPFEKKCSKHRTLSCSFFRMWPVPFLRTAQSMISLGLLPGDFARALQEWTATTGRIAFTRGMVVVIRAAGPVCTSSSREDQQTSSCSRNKTFITTLSSLLHQALRACHMLFKKYR